jgi:hypothetical protein
MTTYTLSCKRCKEDFTSTCKEMTTCHSCIQAYGRRMQERLDYHQKRLAYHKEIHQKPIEEIANCLRVQPSQVRGLFDRMELTVPDEDFWTGLHGQSCPIRPENWSHDTDSSEV